MTEELKLALFPLVDLAGRESISFYKNFNNRGSMAIVTLGCPAFVNIIKDLSITLMNGVVLLDQKGERQCTDNGTFVLAVQPFAEKSEIDELQTFGDKTDIRPFLSSVTFTVHSLNYSDEMIGIAADVDELNKYYEPLTLTLPL